MSGAAESVDERGGAVSEERRAVPVEEIDVAASVFVLDVRAFAAHERDAAPAVERAQRAKHVEFPPNAFAIGSLTRPSAM